MLENNKKAFQILSRLFGTKFFLIPFVSIVLTFSLTSCDKSSDIGLAVQPVNDLLNVSFQDTTTLWTKTTGLTDSLRTDQTIISNNLCLLGKYVDPIFGEATASIYTQLLLPSSITSFGTNPVCDSVILSLRYEPTYYGKKERKQQKINVYQLEEDLSTANVYYSNITKTVSNVDITSSGNGYNFIPRPTDSVQVFSSVTKENPQLRIPLQKIMGQVLLNSPSVNNNLASNANFQNFMKGFYITTENTSLNSGEGNIMRFWMSLSKMILYYHTDTNDSLSYEFPMSSVARFNHYTHHYINTDILTQASTSNPVKQYPTTYIQSMAGVRTKIEIPYIMSWNSKGPIAINKAELVVRIDPNASYQIDTFSVPPKLILFAINDDGTNDALIDYYEGDSYFGGTYDSTTQEYRFNIAREIQQILTGKAKNNGFYLMPTNGAVTANRVAIGGGDKTSAYQMKLNITTTKFH